MLHNIIVPSRWPQAVAETCSSVETKLCAVVAKKFIGNMKDIGFENLAWIARGAAVLRKALGSDF
jgi:hypothetical protein